MTLQHRTCQNKTVHEKFTKILLPAPIRAKNFFPFCPCCCILIFSLFELTKLNKPMDINLVSEQVSFKARESSSNFCVNPFTNGVPIVIGPNHTLVYELGGSN